MKNELMKTTEPNHLELRQMEALSLAQSEIQGAMVLAQKFPRNEKAVHQACIEACMRPTLAAKAHYEFPRGGAKVKGPTVVLARALAQKYRNLRWGLDILRDDEEQMSIRGWAWDIETNTKVSNDDSFKKLIYRKKGGWVKPDERDLRELTFRRGAILIRNCLLQIMPGDLIEDCSNQCYTTIRDNIKDPKAEEKKLVRAFAAYKVTVDMINGYLGHTKWTKDDLVELINIGNSLRDGISKVDEYFDLGEVKKDDKPKINPDKDMETGDSEKHQGYEGPSLDPVKEALERTGKITGKKQGDVFNEK